MWPAQNLGRSMVGGRYNNVNPKPELQIELWLHFHLGTFTFDLMLYIRALIGGGMEESRENWSNQTQVQI